MARFFLNRIFKKTGPPIHLIWFITAKCNLRCSHCFYHSAPSANPDEFSLEEISKTILKFPFLLSVSLTGGEPFLRGDLPEIIKLLTKKRLTENIVLLTNGFDTDNILAMTEKVLSNNRSNTRVFVGVSIDGYEKEHDQYRNKKGAYQRTINTVNGLKKLKNHFLNLNVGVGITLHKGNQYIVKGLREDIFNKLGCNPGITLIRGNPRLSELKDVDADIYRETVEAIARDKLSSRHKSLFDGIVAAREVLGQKIAYETFISRSRSYDCYAGSLMGVIYENGDVYPCEMLADHKLGNLRSYDYDITKIWQSEKANEIRRWIKTRMCFCTYECQYTCNTLYNIKFSRFFISNILKYVSKSGLLKGKHENIVD